MWHHHFRFYKLPVGPDSEERLDADESEKKDKEKEVKEEEKEEKKEKKKKGEEEKEEKEGRSWWQHLKTLSVIRRVALLQ